jgi:PAS domain S-box-containing protein
MDVELDRASEERQLALLVSSAQDYAIFVLNTEGLVLSWNAGAERMKGYTREEIVGRHFSTFYTDEDRARDHPADELRIAERDGRYEEEGWRVRKDGSRFWANIVITTLRSESGELLGFGQVSRDLTSRRLDEEQTRARALELEVANRELTEFRRLVSSVRDYAIFMLDTRGHILSWNEGARRFKGYEPEEIIGRHFSTFYTAADRARNHPAWELEVAERDGRYQEAGWRVRKDGSTFWASVTITAIRDDDGRLTGYAKVTRDLTERKQADDALRQAVAELREANAELDRFASIAAHDMTDPLRTISGFAELIVEDDLSVKESKEFAQHILDSSLRLTGMLRGLLTYARAGRRSARSVELKVGDAAGEVCEDLAAQLSERGIEVTGDIADDAIVICDPHDLRILLQNLVSNAIKFADPADPRVGVQAAPADGPWCAITVWDNGAGIPAEDHRTIFAAFERAPGVDRQAGYGLGLAICQRLAERHGGTITVASAPGDGSRFTVSLPTTPSAADPAIAGDEA